MPNTFYVMLFPWHWIGWSKFYL